MAEEIKNSLSLILEDIQTSRRDFLKRTLLTGGLMAMAAPASRVLARGSAPGDNGEAKGIGKGEGKGQGKGIGKGKGPP